MNRRIFALTLVLNVVVLFAAMFAITPAKAFCWLNCEPGAEQARKVFENSVKTKFDPDAKVVKFEVSRFWRLDVEGSGHKAVEFYFDASVEFPKGANLDCKPEPDGKVKEGCSASTYYSTTIRNQMIKERQYIEPGKTVEFKDETRLDQGDKGWKGQDGNFY